MDTVVKKPMVIVFPCPLTGSCGTPFIHGRTPLLDPPVVGKISWELVEVGHIREPLAAV